MSKDRKDIYLGDGLRRALAGMPGTLSTNVNLIADRYMGIVERSTEPDDLPYAVIQVYRAVLAEKRGHRLEAHEIAVFYNMVLDWELRHPNGCQIATQHLMDYSFAQLVALIDRLERQP